MRRDPGHGAQQQRVPSMAEGWEPASGTPPPDGPGTEAPPAGRPEREVSLHREELSSSDRKSGRRWVTGERKL